MTLLVDVVAFGIELVAVLENQSNILFEILSLLIDIVLQLVLYTQ